ncbi:hypothetical protein M8J75_002723 [Diaphorina citri]|nr:hypothetical protein M8J75_002723 [Diaphorina citri]
MEHNKILTMTMAFHITMAFHTREFPQPRSALFFTEDVIQHPTLCTLMSFNMIDKSLKDDIVPTMSNVALSGDLNSRPPD